MEKEVDIREERIRKIAFLYYSRKDILDTIYKFSQNREISPRYFEGFGKRPDAFQYTSDIINLVKKGATSFHCSEEIWKDPLEISTDLGEEGLNEIRKGWDLVFDIDCKWIDYSKKAAQAIVRALEFRGVKNIGIKFSGSKGFHIIVPWAAFPEEINEVKTKDMFPEWPRAMVNYVMELSRPILADLLKDTISDFKDLEGFSGVKCENCNNLAQESFQITLQCPKCHPPHIEIFNSTVEEYKQRKCPNCRYILDETVRKKFFVCNKCSLNSLINPENFNEGIVATDIYKILGLDILLVSSRHLFRMPYSLHEKTSLASIVLSKKQLETFSLKDADPLNATPINFYPQAEKDEAKELLIQAIDWQKTHEIEHKEESLKFSDSKKRGDYKPTIIEDLKEEDFPPAILKILKGMEDGKKRALFILINFYRALGKTIEETEKIVNEWNQKNKPQLKQGYINAQLIWASKNKVVLPPNFDNEIYKAIGVHEMDSLSEKAKNPVNYVVRKTGAWKKGKKK